MSSYFDDATSGSSLTDLTGEQNTSQAATTAEQNTPQTAATVADSSTDTSDATTADDAPEVNLSLEQQPLMVMMPA